MKNLSSTYLIQSLGGGGGTEHLLFKVLHIHVSHYETDQTDPQPTHRIYFEKRNKYYAGRTLIVQLCSVPIILSYPTE